MHLAQWEGDEPNTGPVAAGAHVRGTLQAGAGLWPHVHVAVPPRALPRMPSHGAHARCSICGFSAHVKRISPAEALQHLGL